MLECVAIWSGQCRCAGGLGFEGLLHVRDNIAHAGERHQQQLASGLDVDVHKRLACSRVRVRRTVLKLQDRFLDRERGRSRPPARPALNV